MLANSLRQTVTHNDAACPGGGVLIKADLIGFGCVDAFEANLEVADRKRITVDDVGDARYHVCGRCRGYQCD
jgi:hypothetical protein